MITNIKYPVLTEKDYILGSERSAPFEVLNPTGDWSSVLVDPEQQKNDRIDTIGCTNFASTSQVEVLLDFLYGIKTNYSERFQAVMSGQTETGNDPQNVYESIRNDGLLPEDFLPFNNDMGFEEYLSPNPMAEGYKIAAKEWLSHYEFKHEYIYPLGTPKEERQRLLLQALKRSPVGVSVYAWHEEGELYTKPEGVQDTHWTVLIGAVEGSHYIVFDSYFPFIKKLDWNSNFFDIAKGIHIKKKETLGGLGIFERFRKLFTFIHYPPCLGKK